ncbi:MAG: apolipoprotein N-acyltransferase [Gammaproteobacteria bacterium]
MSLELRGLGARVAGLRAGWHGDLLALLCGVLTVLAFAPFNAWPLIVFTLAALFWLLGGSYPRRAFWRGLLFGIGEFGFGLYWLYISIHVVSGAPVWATFLVIIGLVLAMAFYSALTCALAAWLLPRAGVWRSALLLPGLWVVLEWLRGWVLSGFPWLSLGYSQIDSVLRGYAPLVGVYGVSLAVALSAGLVLSAALSRHVWARGTCLAVLAGIWMAAALLAGRSWTTPAGAPVQFSLIQGDIPQSLKWDPQEYLVTLERYQRLTSEHWASRVIIWPEAAIPAYADEVRKDYLDPLAAEARAHHTDMLIGILTENLSNGDAYNSVISLGAQAGVYDKRHLVPMAEYFPAPAWVTHWLEAHNLPYASFTPGAPRQPPLRVAGYPVATSICYEDAFGAEIMRDLPQARYLVNVTNDAWFGESIALPQHFEISRMRAVEAGRYLLRTTNTGITAVVNTHGAIVQRLPEDVVGVLTAQVPPYAGSTPYVRWGNRVVVVIGLLLILAGALGRLGRK